MLISSNSTTNHLYHQKTPDDAEVALAMQESVKAMAKSGLSESNSIYSIHLQRHPSKLLLKNE